MIRSHSRSLGKIWNIGENEGDKNVGRCQGNLSSYACDPPTLRVVAKTHKPPDMEGCPKSRPIVGASRGLTTPIGETLSDIIEPVSLARENIWESQSTEEVLRKIKEANLELKKEEAKEIMVGSLDVEALYPSIDQKEGPRIVAQEILKSKVKFENINYHLAAVYLAVTLDKARQEKEGIAHLLPSRKAKTKKGRRPTIHTRELGGPKGRKEVFEEESNKIGKNRDKEVAVEDDDPEESKYFRFHRKYSEGEKRLLLSKVVQIALETTFSNHIYQCQNVLYCQVKGGGIGARITGVVARVVMDLWMYLIQHKNEVRFSFSPST